MRVQETIIIVGGTRVDLQSLIGPFPARLKKVLLEVFLPIEEISKLQNVLKYQRTCPFISFGSKEAGVKWIFCDCLKEQQFLSSKRGGSDSEGPMEMFLAMVIRVPVQILPTES